MVGLFSGILLPFPSRARRRLHGGSEDRVVRCWERSLGQSRSVRRQADSPYRVNIGWSEACRSECVQCSHDSRKRLMPLLRAHNIAVSIDGFATGEGQSFETPFGHAGGRLMEWFFPTRTFVTMTGHESEAVGAGTRGVDDAFAA